MILTVGWVYIKTHPLLFVHSGALGRQIFLFSHFPGSTDSRVPASLTFLHMVLAVKLSSDITCMHVFSLWTVNGATVWTDVEDAFSLEGSMEAEMKSKCQFHGECPCLWEHACRMFPSLTEAVSRDMKERNVALARSLQRSDAVWAPEEPGYETHFEF